jgi:hypothetical protein
VTCAARANAQVYESVGTRAQGMAGAFVAVADDATATWWNPAGLASGAYFSGVIERGALNDPGTPSNAGPARRDAASGLAITVPSLGLSYYHLQVGEVRPLSSPIGGTGAVRQDDGAASVELRTLSLNRFGVTIGQSFTPHFVIASTLALLRGGVSGSTEAAGPSAVDDAINLDVTNETHGDIDLGAMVKAGVLRLGVNVKHMTQPTFGTGTSSMTLARQARAGIALETHAAGAPFTVSGDVDLSKTPTVNGDAQHIAAGIEAWLANRRIGARGGVSANLVGEKRTSASSGLSLAFKTGLYVDGALTYGSDTTRSGWSVTLRATY